MKHASVIKSVESYVHSFVTRSFQQIRSQLQSGPQLFDMLLRTCNLTIQNMMRLPTIYDVQQILFDNVEEVSLHIQDLRFERLIINLVSMLAAKQDTISIAAMRACDVDFLFDCVFKY